LTAIRSCCLLKRREREKRIHKIRILCTKKIAAREGAQEGKKVGKKGTMRSLKAFKAGSRELLKVEPSHLNAEGKVGELHWSGKYERVVKEKGGNTRSIFFSLTPREGS